jgi:hypothetical protein
MTNLEFIEKEIDTYKQLKEQAILRIPDEDDEIQLHLLQRRINIINERLPILEQIKTELEAWEIAKNEIKVKEVQNYFYPQYCICLRYMKGLINKEQYERLKKALEVEDES